MKPTSPGIPIATGNSHGINQERFPQQRRIRIPSPTIDARDDRRPQRSMPATIDARNDRRRRRTHNLAHLHRK